MTAGDQTMTKQFENPQAANIDDKIAPKTSTEKKIDRVAEKAAEKPSKTEQEFDKSNSNLFSK
jgi:hypothetical protein